MIGLKLIRKKLNLNQQKVAMDLNISREEFSKKQCLMIKIIRHFFMLVQ